MSVSSRQPSNLDVRERRYLTILFCDLVGFTELSERLDPEELQALQNRYQRIALSIMESYGGYVGMFSGDGILVYFGYPVAHENDAERAVRAALELIEKISNLEESVGNRVLGALRLRIGVHTGLVVIGPERTSSGQAIQSAIGEPVNLAARLQAEAPSNSVVVSAETLELIEGLFDTEFLGSRKIRGLTRPVDVHKIIGARRTTGSARPHRRRGATRMVGRTEALEQVLAHWRDVRTEMRCHTLFIEGEAGVGKTRLITEFRKCAELDHVDLVQIDCHEFFSSTPLYPIARLLSIRIGLDGNKNSSNDAKTLAAFLDDLNLNTSENVGAAVSLLGIATAAVTSNTSNSPLARSRQFAFIISLIKSMVRLRPGIIWIEDAHWLDPSSAELLQEAIKQLRNMPILILLTLRSFPRGPALPKPDEVIHLDPLSGPMCLELAQSIPGVLELPAQLVSQAVKAGDGIPLFIEQLILSTIDQNALKGNSGGGNKIPLTLAETLSERLDRLSSGRHVVQAAACIGRPFTPEFLGSVLDTDAAQVAEPLDTLVEAEILRSRQDRAERIYEFRHSLLQRAAYESIIQSDRRTLHDRIVTALNASANAAPIIPELIAYHLTAASRFEEAISMWLNAGIMAAQRSAHVEAVENLRKGLALISQISDAKLRREFELRLQAALIGSITATEGSASASLSACCQRGLQLVAEGEPSPLVFPFLFGQFTFTMCTGNTNGAADLAKMFLSLAERNGYAPGRVIGHRLIGMALLGQGDAPNAKEELEKSISLYVAERDEATTYLFGQNTQIHSRSMLSLALFCLGSIDESLRVGIETLQSADTLRHPHSTAISLAYVGGWVLGLSGATDEMAREARRLISLSEQHRLNTFRTFGLAFYGWSQCQRDNFEEGTTVLQQAINDFDAVGYRLSLPGHLANLADAKRRCGKLEEAKALCSRAMQIIAEGSDRWLEPEVRRVEAQVVSDLKFENDDKIELLFRKAVACACDLRFPVFELRCLRSLQQFLGTNHFDSKIENRIGQLLQFHNLAERVTQSLQDRKVKLPTATQIAPATAPMFR